MTKRFKLRYEFWLEDKPDHHLVAGVIADFKRERLFASAVRDGLMLVADLRKGSIELLLHLFPWIEQAVMARHPELTDLPTQQEFAAMRGELDVLRAWVTTASIQQGETRASAGQGSKPMNIPNIPSVPADDDDDIIVPIKKAKSDGKASAENFLSSAFSLLG